MLVHRSFQAVLTVALLVLVGSNSVASAAKCYTKPKDNLTPTVTEAPLLEDPSPVTQGSFGASQASGGSSFPAQSSGSYEAAQSSQGASPTQTATEAPAAQSGSYGETPTSGDASAAQPPTTTGSSESSEASQGSSAQTQGSSDVSTGNSTSASSGDHATFGDITSASGKCVIESFLDVNYLPLPPPSSSPKRP
ncbi:hypothetical protein PHYPSEUDO_009245 [Phytophthora pseudosyringae]|uniref:Uncharacterized protein n=1 Tax=Phytophthora pseudosyringae TaxID=221518 RepID=A0A8T1VHT0_9STRA|nr:hypothetical protein PHYPSEUDO_009245 [Phytophthora pseudosyringae]